MLYLVHTEDVSPDSLRSSDRRESLQVQREPCETNMSHQERTKGWLGTTNDMSEHALGEFDDDDLAGLLSTIEDSGFTADHNELTSWIESDDGEPFTCTMTDDVHEGEAYRFTIRGSGDETGQMEDFQTKPGYVYLDGEWDGFGNESCEHELAHWQEALDAAGIWYEDAAYETIDTGGCAGFWAIWCRAGDEAAARAAAGWECDECGDHEPRHTAPGICRQCEQDSAEELAAEIEGTSGTYDEYTARHVHDRLFPTYWKSGAPHAGPWRVVGEKYSHGERRRQVPEAVSATIQGVRAAVEGLPVEVTLRECTGPSEGHSRLAVYVTHAGSYVCYRVALQDASYDLWRMAAANIENLRPEIAQTGIDIAQADRDLAASREALGRAEAALAERRATLDRYTAELSSHEASAAAREA